jgi:hypothetical protein
MTQPQTQTQTHESSSAASLLSPALSLSLSLARFLSLSISFSLSFSLSLSLSPDIRKEETWDVDGELDRQEQMSRPHDTYTSPMLLVYAAYATSVCGLKLPVHAALSYKCRRPEEDE